MIRSIRFIAAGTIASITIVAAVPLTAYALGLPTAFGGKITVITPCAGTGGFVLATIVRPPLLPLSVAALPSQFLYFMMSHPNQNVLGLLGPPTFCATGLFSGGFTPTAFFYGTSK